MVTISVEMPEAVDTVELEQALADLGLVDERDASRNGGWLVFAGKLESQRDVARALATVHGWAAEHRVGSVRIRVAGLRPSRSG